MPNWQDVAKEIVTYQREQNNPDDAAKSIDVIRQKYLKKLSSYRGNKNHSNPLHYEACKNDIGLKVKLIEGDNILQDLIVTVHHCYMHALMNTGAYKIIENQIPGSAFIKLIQMQVR